MAQVVAANGHQGFRVGVQLLQRVRDVDDGNDGEHHALVPGGEVV